MNEDLLKQATELLEKFDGKITQGKWGDVIDSELEGHNIWIALDVEEEWYLKNKSATELDIEAMTQVPEMLNIIKGLLGKQTRNTGEQSKMKHLTDTLIYKMALAETIGRHLTNLEGKHDDLVSYYIALSEELRKELNFQGRTRDEINEMRLETILWCKDKLEAMRLDTHQMMRKELANITATGITNEP